MVVSPQEKSRPFASTIALIALGANLPGPSGTPSQSIDAAVRALRLLDRSLLVSRYFSTPAFPAGSGPDFVNAAAKMTWTGSADGLLEALHNVEHLLGRQRGKRWEARVVDLDLLAYGGLVLPDADTEAYWRHLPVEDAMKRTPDGLVLPHPRLAERAFVLVPLADLVPDWVHPATGRSVAEMCAALDDAETAAIQPL